MDPIIQKTCCKCKIEKPLSDYYSKGVGRFEAHCKKCALEYKKTRRDAEIMNQKNLRAKTKEPVRESVWDYKFNERGIGTLTLTIHCPDLFTKRVTTDRALELYHQNLSFEEICDSLDRSERWVRDSLAKYGIYLGGKENRKDVQDVPYGWKLSNDKLCRTKSEQWLLQKAADDMKTGLSLKEISSNFNQLNIKAPKGHNRWSEELLSRVIKMNKRLKNALPEPNNTKQPDPVT